MHASEPEEVDGDSTVLVLLDFGGSFFALCVLLIYC
jgi:hypothetical protein